MSWFNSFHGLFVAIAHTGELEHDYLGLYDTEAKARSIAKTHYHDTGQLVEVYRLEFPERVAQTSSREAS